MTATAKLFMNGRSQAVRLPMEFRMPGTEVKVSRQGSAIVLEPVETPVRGALDVKAWRAQLRDLGAADFLAEGLPEDSPVQPEDFGID
jgi:antitoxin VapB